MKRKAIYIIMVSLLAAAAVSCTREIQVPDGEEATLTVTASLDAAMDDGTKASADGGLTNLAAQGGYSLRYNMELWSEDGKTLEYSADTILKKLSPESEDYSVQYSLNLLAKKYKMVLWADIVDIDGNAAYNVSNGLTAIRFPEESAFVSDEYDAFTAVADVDLIDGSKVIGAILKRPFAKIRVIDMTESDPGTEYTTKLTFDNPVSIPVEYNALAGDVTSATDGITGTPTCTSTSEDGTRLCLFTGYIFVPKDQQSTKYSFTIVVSDENNTSVANVPVYDVTVRRNALTTVKEEIL